MGGMAHLTLSVLPLKLAVCRVRPDTPVPAAGGDFWSLTRTPDEVSLVCEEYLVPDGMTAEGGWAVFKLHGPFPFDLTGILTSVLEPLRDAEIGIFALSTFDTEYVLVNRAHLTEAVNVLRAAGHTVLEA